MSICALIQPVAAGTGAEDPDQHQHGRIDVDHCPDPFKHCPARLKMCPARLDSVAAFEGRPHARLKITAQGSFLQAQAEALPAGPQEVGKLIPTGDPGDGIKHGQFGEARL
ncbi:MAG: hypothetical protein DMG60_20600 [Acidobacteria bacterium]|nr:MAG: hypothetical protein DMG60_20600 [Acidobacteriota bacterium]